MCTIYLLIVLKLTEYDTEFDTQNMLKSDLLSIDISRLSY